MKPLFKIVAITPVVAVGFSVGIERN